MHRRELSTAIVLISLVFGFVAFGPLAPQAAGDDCGLLGCASPGGPLPTPTPSVPPVAPPSGGEPTAPEPEPEPEREPSPEPPPAVQPDPAAAAARLLHLANEERQRRGLPVLVSRSDVTDIAAGHSAAMAERRDIWHNDSYFTAATKQRLQARTVGENVAVNSSIDDAHRRLMNSPGHRANILNGRFTVVGMAAAHRDGAWYITQDFVELLRQKPSTPGGERPRSAAGTGTPAPAATPVPTDQPLDVGNVLLEGAGTRPRELSAGSAAASDGGYAVGWGALLAALALAGVSAAAVRGGHLVALIPVWARSRRVRSGAH